MAGDTAAVEEELALVAGQGGDQEPQERQNKNPTHIEQLYLIENGAFQKSPNRTFSNLSHIKPLNASRIFPRSLLALPRPPLALPSPAALPRAQTHLIIRVQISISMKTCFFYIKASDTPPNPEEIRKGIVEGSPADKVKTMKEFLRCLVQDDTYPPMIMTIITNIIPLLPSHPELRKVLLLYWEVIEKSKSPNDPTLKDEMFLACNSLRSDLLSHNQYLRGRTLRLISRIMHKGVIEPLSSAITDCITHKSAYVRRNTVVCLYNVFCNFGSDIIGDIDEEIEEMLKTETDLSTKRNAFILLYKSNQAKAMEYLQLQVANDALEDIGDILQLAILKVLRQNAREDPGQRAKILKIINSFTFKASESVLLECSITALAISNSVMSIKTALAAYVSILARTNELNVKKIVLDKLETACRNSNYIEESLVEDLIKSLKTPSYEIKIKILNIVAMNLNPKISELILKELKVEIQDCENSEYQLKIIRTTEDIAAKFPQLHPQIMSFITSKLFKLPSLSNECALSLGRALRVIVIQKEKKGTFKKDILEAFKTISSRETIKEVLNIIGNFYESKAEVEKAINCIRINIGALPIALKSKVEENTEPDQEKAKNKMHFKTKIMEDGSYRMEQIEQAEEGEAKSESEETGYFREALAEDSIVGGVFTRCVGKLLYRVRQSAEFNRYACSILMILCSLLRNYEQHIYQVDQATIDQISTLVRKLINPQQFIDGKDRMYEVNREQLAVGLSSDFANREIHQQQVLEKNPSDLIFFRQLKKGAEDMEFDDEEVNQILSQNKKSETFVERLKSMVQLTGHFDALYAESFITVNKYDILFEILLINTTKANMLNVQVEFSSTAEIMILEKAQSVNLRPYQSAEVRTQIRFTTGEFGSIYGYVNYDNQSGIEQPYLITEEIKIDYMQFIIPSRIRESEFKIKWAGAEGFTELKHEVCIKGKQPGEQGSDQKDTQTLENVTYEKIHQLVESQLHCLRVEELNQTEEDDEYFLSKSFYGKSKLGEDFQIIATFFKDTSIDITFTLRSKDVSVANMIHRKLEEIDFDALKKVEEEEEEEEEGEEDGEEGE